MTVDTEVAIISVIVNSVLAVLTGSYVLLTYALLKQARNAAANSEALFRSQILISTMPHLELRVRRLGDGYMIMTLTNWGQSPALDIDMWFLGSYDEDKAQEIRLLSKPEYIEAWEPDSEDFYYLFERAMHPGISGGHRLTERLYLPAASNIHCFLQFRTYTGQNLWMYVWLYDRSHTGNNTYTIGSSEPSTPTPIDRTDLEPKEGGGYRFVYTDASLKNEDFVRNFVEGFERSASWVPKDEGFHEIEDRGKVTKVS
jgi:hypothetical protein